ncbi:hypothetical protein J437_LFUL015875 [Ladona fulva]|uniref:Ion transport domain-containing protein n=1 Tax=Ladona fulva TaxID=123851 RepID=A0A8K0NUS7_LADFU|nr:hypothetical protein J437_LFUL015875 [Ladona fulva]
MEDKSGELELLEKGEAGVVNPAYQNELLSALKKKDLEGFKRLLPFTDINHFYPLPDSGTCLYIAASKGLEGFISFLLENPRVDPNGTCAGEKWKPLLLAALQGNHNALKILVGHDKTDLTVVDELRQETALHKAARMQSGSREDMNYLQSIEILIGAMKGKGSDKDPLLHKRLNIDAVDAFGNTALHYAARNLDRGSREAEKIVSALLRAGAYVGIRNNMGEPGISRVTPSLLEDYLDECIGTNDEPPCEESYVLTFNYSMLIPPCSVSNDPNREADSLENSALFKETEPLSYICNNKEYQNLLKHPIITSFLYLKWHRIRGIFLVNLIFYMFFVAFITAYILGVYGTDPPDDSDEDSTSMQWTDACSAVSVIFLAGLALRELFQFIMSPLLYIKSLENILEIAVIVLSVTMLFSSLDHEIKQHLAAVIILFVWIELVLLIGRHPKLSTYITMFTAVSWNFLKFLLWYALFIIAFALSFFILFRQGKKSEKGVPDQPEEEEENLFANAGGAMLKTAVMLTGEFDFSDLPLETFKLTSHLVFLLFLFLIAVVLLNLLNGLAVSDTQEVKDKAELVGYKSRVLLVSHVESMLLGKKLQFLNKIMTCFHSNENKAPVNLVERSSLFPSIMIFPEMTKIIVLVNAGGKIKPRCCSSRKNSSHFCSMDPMGLPEFVEVLIEQGADVNGYNNICKDTPLHAACKEARPEVVKLLLKHGANSSEKDKFGRHPLHEHV